MTRAQVGPATYSTLVVTLAKFAALLGKKWLIFFCVLVTVRLRGPQTIATIETLTGGCGHEWQVKIKRLIHIGVVSEKKT